MPVALVNLKSILSDADANRYAVGAFNVVNLESLQAILEAAEAERSPIILNVAEVHFKYVDLDLMAPVIRQTAEKASIPVAMHLDHGLHFETVVKAIRWGFTSVMFDGSRLPYEENVEQTREVSKMAHAAGLTVEGELGRIGGAEGENTASEVDSSMYTDPQQAVDFVRRTEVDALAVAIGTAHGLYKSEPRLDFARLAEIKKAVGIPLVLHGGSGISDDDFRRAVNNGISKINFYTQMSQSATRRIREIVDAEPDFISFPDLLIAAREAIKETVRERIRVFGSSNVCSVPNVFCQSCGACVLAGETQCSCASQIECAGPATAAAAAASTADTAAEEQGTLERVIRQVVQRVLSENEQS